ncbi:Protein NYNRIN, partial [Acanthisitta chloris]
INTLMIRGAGITEVGQTQVKVIGHLGKIGLQIPPEKVQLPSSEVKFLAIWWRGGAVCIPQDTPALLEEVKIPGNKKVFQFALGLLVFWRKHIPDFSIIARPLYDLTRKRPSWGWRVVCEEALKLLVLEAGIYQVLGPIHPQDFLQVEWAFAIHGLLIHAWQ